MSNARIADRLAMLADRVELGQVTVRDFIDQLLGHTNAMDGLAYSQHKEAQEVREQLRRLVEQGDEHLVNVHAVGDWLRDWLSRATGEST